MAQGKFIAYYRVSTQKQGRSGLGLEAQQKAVRDYLNGGSWDLIEEVVEVESGKRSDRPQLAEALRLCRLHKATLVIAKLDRLARNVHFVSSLMKAKVPFVAVDFPAANDLTIHVMAAVAEHEAAAISARTKAALAAAKERGKCLGGLRDGGFGNAEQRQEARRKAVEALRARADAFAADVLPQIKSLVQEKGLSLRAAAACLNKGQVATARGNLWTAAAVRNVLLRAA